MRLIRTSRLARRCGLRVRGQVYSGCNVENVAYPEGTCAEAGAIAAMVAAGEQELTEVYVVASSPQPVPPCGGCRQKLAEFGTRDVKGHSGDRADGAELRNHHRRIAARRVRCLSHGRSMSAWTPVQSLQNCAGIRCRLVREELIWFAQGLADGSVSAMRRPVLLPWLSVWVVWAHKGAQI